MDSGRRVWDCELSTVDTAYLIAGALCAAAYFEGADSDEAEIRRMGDELYRRVDWEWATAGGGTITHGWKPRDGFLPHRWRGYSEAILLYLLALGSPTHPVPPRSYAASTSSYKWKKLYGLEFLYAGPLFIHQLSHVWVDFRGIRDAPMRARGIDYFENSRRATFAHQRYAMRNPRKFEGYGEFCWGITACEGPGPATMTIRGVKRRFFDYVARAIPYGPDDGTLAPWAVVASLPFAPEIVLPTIRRDGARKDQSLRIRGDLQSDLPVEHHTTVRLGLSQKLRPQQRPDRGHDRKLPLRPDLEDPPEVPVSRSRSAPRRVSRRVVAGLTTGIYSFIRIDVWTA
jgi:hypothetical protein